MAILGKSMMNSMDCCGTSCIHLCIRVVYMSMVVLERSGVVKSSIGD